MTLPITGPRAPIVRAQRRDHKLALATAHRASCYDGRVRGTSARLLIMGALDAAGCTHQRTELVVGLMTDLSATDMVDTVTLGAERAGVALFSETWIISGMLSQPAELPGSFC